MKQSIFLTSCRSVIGVKPHEVCIPTHHFIALKGLGLNLTPPEAQKLLEDLLISCEELVQTLGTDESHEQKRGAPLGVSACNLTSLCHLMLTVLKLKLMKY